MVVHLSPGQFHYRTGGGEAAEIQQLGCHTAGLIQIFRFLGGALLVGVDSPRRRLVDGLDRPVAPLINWRSVIT